MTRPAAIEITVTLTPEGSTLELSYGQVSGLKFEGTLSEGKLEAQRQGLAQDLEFFKSCIKEELCEDGIRVEGRKGRFDRITDRTGKKRARRVEQKLTEAVGRLYERGRLLAGDLFGRRRIEAQRIFHAAYEKWGNPVGEDGDTAALPLVEVKTGRIDSVIPIEFVPIFDVERNPIITSKASLAEAMSPFIGFSTVVKRTVTRLDHLGSRTELKADPRLPVKFFFDPSLKGAMREFQFFNGRQNIFLDPASFAPLFDKTRDFPSDISEQLWLPRLSFNNEPRNSPHQIHHFACHCITEGKTGKLALSPTRWVTLDQLRERYQKMLSRILASPRGEGPLVFFNACGTSNINPAWVTSFPQLFLENEAGGFIGTETAIPDTFAAAFAEEFYTELLGNELLKKKPRPLGEALQSAKWKLLWKGQNPLGILYVAYANPDMRVR